MIGHILRKTAITTMDNKIHDYDIQTKQEDNKLSSLAPICRVIKVSSYVICLSLFMFSSFNIFKSYAENITIKSTKISPNDIIETPTLLLCNSTAYKKQSLPTSMASYQNNTMKMEDVLANAYFIANTNIGLLSYNPSPIMGDVKEIATIFHGNCIISKERFKVIYIETLKLCYPRSLYWKITHQ